MSRSYADRLAAIQEEVDSLVCVGLDPDPDRIPKHLIKQLGLEQAIRHFVREIVEATHAYCVAYKLNFAFFESLGTAGLQILADSRDVIPTDRVVIADAKRGDIGNTARFYAKSVFDEMNFDAITISPYMGSDSVTPFLAYPDKGTYVLIRTSNSGAASIQLSKSVDGEHLYQRVSRLSQSWANGLPGSLGYVMGATDSGALRAIRSAHPETPLLIPGIGAQGGDTSAVIAALRPGSGPVVINSSRAILFASEGQDFASTAADAAKSLRDLLRG